eukprot:jgi/Hompol1/6809/HPOL_002295-RA
MSLGNTLYSQPSQADRDDPTTAAAAAAAHSLGMLLDELLSDPDLASASQRYHSALLDLAVMPCKSSLKVSLATGHSVQEFCRDFVAEFELLYVETLSRLRDVEQSPDLEMSPPPPPPPPSAAEDDKNAAAEWIIGSEDNLADTGDSNSQPAKPKTRRDLWTLIKEAKDRDKKSNNDVDSSIETTLFVVGSKSSGKSSLILRFLDRDEVPSPSVALEYTFGRRTRGVNSTKDVTHIWELAGGTSLSDLLDIPITESNIHTSAFIIVLDLSAPSTLLDTLEVLLSKIHSRSAKILEGLESRGSKRPKALHSYALKKYGTDHPDKDLVKLSPIPIAIIGSKFDEIKDMESEMRKLLCKTLRYIAHTNGASLLFSSHKDENLVARARQLLSHYAFRGSSIKSMSIDHNKPIVVMAGQDTLSGIGLPPSEMAKEALGRQTFPPYERWKADYERYFPKHEVQAKLEQVDLSKYPEPVIDAIRAQKEQVWPLEKLRRGNDRKIKDKDAVSGITGMSVGNHGKDKKKGKSYSRAK